MVSKEKEFDSFINNLTKENSNINKRILQSECGNICILFIKQLTDRVMLSNYIIKPVIEYCSSAKKHFSVEQLLNNAIFVDDCKVESGYEKIHENLLSGLTVILFSWEDKHITANLKKVEQKAISGPELTYTLRGPRDSFTENLDVNLSLIRYRIKDPNLKTDMCKVGRRTKTRVAVLYIEDISNKGYVDDIIKRIKKIDTDGINESGELQAFLLNNSLNLFPQMGLIERSDMACSALLEGKVIVITEGSGIALVAPRVFGEFLQSCDDIYDNKYMGTFSKVIRFLSLNISYSLTSLYVAIVSFHNDILPGEYIITLATTRAGVPFNAFTEALIVEFVTEALREALIRVPKQIGPAIGIVGAIIIGQAAIAAGIFSPLILIISSISLLTSFVAPDYTIINPFRILKFLMLFVTGIFGLLGFTMGVCFIVTNIISSNSFSVPYFAPNAPLNWRDFVKSIFYSKSIVRNRPNFLKTKDNTRNPKKQ